MSTHRKSEREESWIVGVGRVGKHIAAAEEANGIAVRLFDARRRSVTIDGKKKSIDRGPMPGSPQRMWFCMPDEEIEYAINEWAAAGAKPIVAVHVSGWNSPDLLIPVSAERLSFHPMRSLPGKKPDELIGASVSLCGTPNAVDWGKWFVKSISGKAVVVKDTEKAWLHLICQLAANVPFATLAAIERVSKQVSVPKRFLQNAVQEMMAGTIANGLTYGVSGAATGPVARGNIHAVKATMTKLETDPLVQAYYRAYSRLLAEVLIETGERELRGKWRQIVQTEGDIHVSPIVD